MKRTLTAFSAAVFLAIISGPAMAGPGCGGSVSHTADLQDGSSDPSAQITQSTPVATPEVTLEQTPAPTQTASTDEESQ